MKKIICVIVLVFCITSTVEASNWEFEFFGINPKDFKDRNVMPIIVGALTSFVAHEAGHMFFGNMVGMKTHYDFDDNVVYSEKRNANDHDRFIFASGGFFAQFIVGGVLTAIPSTRHSDFNVGFNGFTFVNSGLYAATGGASDDRFSDIHNITKTGIANGEIVGGLSSLTGGIFTYIALDKE